MCSTDTLTSICDAWNNKHVVKLTENIGKHKIISWWCWETIKPVASPVVKILQVNQIRKGPHISANLMVTKLNRELKALRHQNYSWIILYLMSYNSQYCSIICICSSFRRCQNKLGIENLYNCILKINFRKLFGFWEDNIFTRTS